MFYFFYEILDTDEIDLLSPMSSGLRFKGSTSIQIKKNMEPNITVSFQMEITQELKSKSLQPNKIRLYNVTPSTLRIEVAGRGSNTSLPFHSFFAIISSSSLIHL